MTEQPACAKPRGVFELFPFPARPDAARHAAIVAAVRKLKPATNVDGLRFAIDELEWYFSLAPRAVTPRWTLPSEAASELRKMATHLRGLRESIRYLSGRARHEAGWSALPPLLSNLAEIDALIETAEKAASRLENQKRAGNPHGRQPQAYLAALCAHLYELVTGKPPPVSGSPTRFSAFVGNVFTACNVNADRNGYFARVGAEIHRREREGNPAVDGIFVRLE